MGGAYGRLVWFPGHGGPERWVSGQEGILDDSDPRWSRKHERDVEDDEEREAWFARYREAQAAQAA